VSVSELIYDWNKVDPELQKPNRHIGFDDETLRDGLQSPSVCEPPVEKKIELLHLMDALESTPQTLACRAPVVPMRPASK
jgi:2-isopropylmalate synthase